MAPNAPDPTPVSAADASPPPAEMSGPGAGTPPPAPEPEAIPLAELVDATEDVPAAESLLPVFEEAELPPPASAVEPEAGATAPAPVGDAPSDTCPYCQAPRRGPQSYCDDCGLIFPCAGETAAASPEAVVPTGLLQGRYEFCRLLSRRGEVLRYVGRDHGAETGGPAPVVIVKAPVPRPAASPAAEVAAPAATPEDEDALAPILDVGPDGTHPITGDFRDLAPWPGIAWEEVLLQQAGGTFLPAVRGGLVEGDWEYLIEEGPVGRPFWDAWDDPEATAAQRFGWLRQIAEGLDGLHRAGVIVESLRPDILVLTPEGRPRLTDLSELLPWPLPPDAPLRPTLYTAPELVLAGDRADARADLYGFGAMLYALHVGRELADSDFDGPGFPRPFLAQFPDAHPALGRLLAKTFCRPLAVRFPTDEAFREDPTGFADLMRQLDVCRRTLDNVRLEIAAWTTTGMVRTGNEDAFALLHAAEARQDDLGESALILLADGMGGYEAGEVAAALAIQVLRRYLLEQPPFALLAGGPLPAQPAFDLEACKEHLRQALKEANREVFQAARRDVGRRGMGCTAEAVYVTGRHVVVGHVGDSRTYHLHEGRLTQLTCDHTLVSRLVELGTLTPEEAERHPRKSELQQAIGGHADVTPALYHAALKPGDWVVVCSDGLSNHVTPAELQQMLQSEATSAETAARRLVNLANVKGALDNATVVVVRAL